MKESERERDRCLAIVEAEMEGASTDTRRVLTRVANLIRSGHQPN